jgi:uncharacterized protein (TIGR03435 family)
VEASTKALGQTPRFEVISIKPNMSEDSTMQMDPPIGGRLAARNVSVNWLIKFAWKLRWDQISGGTGWIGSSKSDVDARAADPAAHEDQLRQMTRSLLAERFGLRVHPETRQQQIYTLILAKSNANAPTSGLHKSAGCGELAQSPAPDGPPPCPAFTMSAAGQLSARASTMNDLSRVLSDMTGRAVTDRTSLTGAWDFQVTWTPDGATSGANAPHPEDTGPSIFTALQGTAWAQAPVGTRTCGASGYRSGRKALGKLSGRKNCVYNLS